MRWVMRHRPAGSIDRLRERLADAQLGWTTNVDELTATQPHNWRVAETFTTLANQGLRHAPVYPTARLELEFLQELGNGRLQAPKSGPVRTKDLFDAMSNVAYLITRNNAQLFHRLGAIGIHGAVPGHGTEEHPLASAFRGAVSTRAANQWDPKMSARRMNPDRR